MKLSAQIAYLNHFLSLGLFQYAEELFKRFLRTSSSVDLWKFYLTYVRFIVSKITYCELRHTSVIVALQKILTHFGLE